MIKLTNFMGKVVCVNPDLIISVEEDDKNGSRIYFNLDENDTYLPVRDSLEETVTKIMQYRKSMVDYTIEGYETSAKKQIEKVCGIEGKLL